MNTKEIIDRFIDTNRKVKKPNDYLHFFSDMFPIPEDWMYNAAIQERIRILIFENTYVKSSAVIKQKIRSALNKIDDFNIATIITDATTWKRRINDNLAIRSASVILQYSVLLTTSLAKDLRGSYGENFKRYINILEYLAENLNNALPNVVMAKLCPFNFSKEYTDWISVINDDRCSNFDYHPITPFDILCSYLFLVLWHCNRSANEIDEHNKVFEQWNRYVIECADNESIIQRNKNSEDIKVIFDSISSVEEKNDSSDDLIGAINSGNENELYRDSKFLRQSDLYKTVDQRAINRVLEFSIKKDLTVLDLGCGDGEVTCTRFGKCKNFAKIVAIDIDESQIETARQKVMEYGIEEKVVLDKLDMNSNSFIKDLTSILEKNNIHGIDVIFAALSLHKTRYPEDIVNGLSENILNEGGFFIIREIDDDTKIYYSEDSSNSSFISEAADEYKKIFGFTDRNCARKMNSWLINSGLEHVKLFYDIIDTCEKSKIERNDIFNIMVGFRKARAEKELNRWRIEDIEKYHQFESSGKRIISANDSLLKLFNKDTFWFLAINYVAVAQKPVVNTNVLPQLLKRDVEILLIRHAEGTYNDDTGTYIINEEGKKQINVLNKYLANIKIDGIYSSAMERAIVTAKPIADQHHLQINVYKELDEIDRGDIVSDRDWGLYNDYYLRWKRHEDDLEFPRGENGEAVWLRARYVIDQIVSEATSHTESSDIYRACVFTHGGTLRALVCGMLGIPQSARYQLIEEFDNCSITRIKVNCNSFSNVNTSIPYVMLSLNDTSYRKGLL